MKAATKKKTMKRTKGCNCIQLCDDQLREHNAQIIRNFYLNGELTEPMVAIEKINKNRRSRLPALYCTYCPFCGQKFR